jgi:CRP-like cAMP-binding protein
MDNIEKRITWLHGVGILAGTPEHVLVQVAKALTEVSVEAGQTIFAKGEMGDSLYIIADGKVGIFNGPLLLAYHSPSEVFGEMAVLDSQTRCATAVATTDCRLYQLSNMAFRRLLREHSEVAEGVITVLCERLRDTNTDRSEDYEYIRMVGMITAAAHDLELGTFRPETLDEVTQRTDALGHLARKFEQMAREVQAREEALKQQVRELRIEIDPTLMQEDSDTIFTSDFFKRAQEAAARQRSHAVVARNA